MFRNFNFRRTTNSNQRTSNTKQEYVVETSRDFDDGDSQSLTASSLADERPTTLPIYQTHSFQQRFYKDHPVPGVKMEKFASFITRAALSFPTPAYDGPDHAPRPKWWSFDRDYDEKEDDADEEEEINFGDHVLHSSSLQRTPPSLFSEEAKHDDFYGQDAEDKAFHLFAQHTIIRAALQDLGSHNVHYHLQGTEPDDEVETVDSESSEEFQPRIQDGNDNGLSEAHNVALLADDFSQHNNVKTFLKDASVRPLTQSTIVEKCFENILLVSPEYFVGFKEPKHIDKDHNMLEKKHTESSESPTLSNLVHPMNLDLFQATPKNRVQRANNLSAITSTSNSAPTIAKSKKSSSVPQTKQCNVASTGLKTGVIEKIRKNLASSFRSKASGSTARVRYSLSKGTKGMTEEERQYAKSLLPVRPILSPPDKKHKLSSTSTRIPRGMPQLDGPLSILLIHPALKIFEIVLVDFQKDTTVGDALAKARVNATDEVLSEQKYVSLCNHKQELAAPMLPVSLLVGRPSFQSQATSDRATLSKTLLDEDTESIRRRDMEARLLVAVPAGSTASTCQAIRRMLWSNPKVKRWWEQSDPFHQHTNIDGVDTSVVEPTKKQKKHRAERKKRSPNLE